MLYCLCLYLEMERKMADSNLTKRALAKALKELMQEKPFEKISISDICERCQMNRKSFYYHFIDKYDLVNWIFDTEFIATVQKTLHGESWEVIIAMSELLYNNRAFYKKALLIQGQNSFSEHFHEMLFSIISTRFEGLMDLGRGHEFQTRFYTDALVMAYKKWIIEDANMTPDVFLEEIRGCLKIVKEKDI